MSSSPSPGSSLTSLPTFTSDTLALTGLDGVVRNRRGREDEAAKDDRGTCVRGKALTSGRIGFMIALWVAELITGVNRIVRFE